MLVRVGVEAIRTVALSLVDAWVIAATAFVEMFKKAGNLVLGVFKGLGKALVALLTGDWDAVGDIMKDTLTDAMDEFKSIGETYAGMWKKQGESLANNFAEGYERVMSNKMEEVTVEGLKDSLSGGIETIKKFVIEKAKELGLTIPQSITDAINNAAKNATSGTDGGDDKPEEDPVEEFQNMTKAMYFSAEERNKRMASFNAQFNQTLQNGVANMITGLSRTIAAGGNVMEAFKGMIGGFMQTI